MLRARRATPALRDGELVPLDLPPPLLGFDRVRGAARMRCVFNLSAAAAAVPPALAKGTHALPPAPVPGVPEVLAPWGVGIGTLG
jgi:hypothetical protein